MLNFGLLLSTLFLLCGRILADDDLLLVQIVHRHGDRSPVSLFPGDPNNVTEWPRGLGQLTTTGIWRAYNLGKFLKAQYVDTRFLPAMFNVSDVVIRSTDYDRTLMTAQALLTGMYPPDEAAAKWNPDEKDFPWQPIPVHTVPKDEDLILRYGNDCPRYDQLKYERFKILTPPLKKFFDNSTITGILENATKSSGATGPYLMLYKLYDTLLIDGQNNLTLPDWVTDEMMEALHEVTLLGNQLLTWTDEMKRLAGGNLLATILKNAKTKMANLNKNADEIDGKKNHKAFIYSAHDSTVLALLGALDHNYTELPHYNAYIAAELYRGSAGPYLRFLYRNDGDIEPRTPEPITLPACPRNENCTLHKVVKYYNRTRHLVVRDYAKECGIGDDTLTEKEKQLLRVVTGLATTLGILLLVFLIIGVYATRQYLRERTPSKHEF